MHEELLIPKITEYELLWLAAIYEILKNGKKPNIREIRVALNDHLPHDFHPSSIDSTLLWSDGERITLLGIMAVEGNKSIMEKTDKVILSIKEMILEQPTIEKISLDKVEKRSGISIIEVRIILDLINNYSRSFYRDSGSEAGSTGTSFVTIQENHIFYQYMRFTSIEPLIMEHLRLFQQENDENSSDTPSHADRNKNFTTARQVLAMTFLLKKCGINPVDTPTPVGKFIQFLTGKELTAKRIQDTRIYKKAQQPYKLNDEALLKDLHFIRSFFVEMKLNDIVSDIDIEIEKSEKSG